MNQIGILGAGTWGTALARMLANKGESVTVWSAVGAEIDELAAKREHRNLAGVKLPDSIEFTKDIKEACEGKEVIVFAVPSVYIRSTAVQAKPYIPADRLIVSVAKGLEAGTLLTMTEIIESELGHGERIAALSGPTHAEEVAVDLPTAIVAACSELSNAVRVQEIFSGEYFRVYTNDDIKGAELCGALKNIIALAAGISDGLGYGDNTKAAILTRGIAEITRLGIAMGCNWRTFVGLAGIGDLIVTATSRHSRNNRAGFLIGQGLSAQEAKEKVGMVVEGLNALDGAMALKQKYGVEMPIVEAVDGIVNRGADARETVGLLMDREKKHEYK